MNDCGICFEIMERDLWHCEQCNGELHQECYKYCNEKCPFCRHINSYTDCTLFCFLLLFGIYNYIFSRIFIKYFPIKLSPYNTSSCIIPPHTEPRFLAPLSNSNKY